MIQELEQLGKDKSFGAATKLDESSKQPLLQPGADLAATQSLRVTDVGATLVAPENDSAERVLGHDGGLNMGLISAPLDAAESGGKAAGSPPGGGSQAQLAPASPRNQLAPAPEEANAARPPEKAGLIELDTSISRQDVRARQDIHS